MDFQMKYVIIRREPHGEVVDTYVMACANNTADAEEFILNLAEDYSYTAFCGAIYLEDKTIDEAIEISKEAEEYYIANCMILPVVEV